MTNVLPINPKLLRICPAVLHFPTDTPFRIADQYNGRERGTWFFVSPKTGLVRGPFRTVTGAYCAMNTESLA